MNGITTNRRKNMKLELSVITVLLIAAFLVQPAVLSAQARPGDPDYKEPMLAFLFSFLIPGLGQIWVGDMTRGLIFFGIYVGIWVLAGVLLYATIGLSFIFAPLVALAFSVYAGIDAMNLAKKYNAGGGRLALLEEGSPNLQPVIAVGH